MNSYTELVDLFGGVYTACRGSSMELLLSNADFDVGSDDFGIKLRVSPCPLGYAVASINFLFDGRESPICHFFVGDCSECVIHESLNAVDIKDFFEDITARFRTNDAAVELKGLFNQASKQVKDIGDFKEWVSLL